MFKILPLILLTFTFCAKAEEIFYLKVGKYEATAFYYSETRLLTAAHTFQAAKTKECYIVKDGEKIACR